MPLSPGHKLGPYEILSQIGEGGMGEVYKARDTRLDRIVAIKLSKSEFSERFEREARAVASLNHPHICQLYDVGPNYLVMEFVEGPELRGPLPLEKAIAYATQILDALHAAHRKRITHRDLKPANIIVTSQGIKLLDFGLAKLDAPLAVTDATLVAAPTTQGQIVGTLQYMSPEQMQAKPVDARSDIFSFGCVLYEMLTGRRAFEGESTASVIAAILERQPEPANLASPLQRILTTCLAKDPDQRFQDALDLKRNLLWAMEQPSDLTIAPRRIPIWAIATITALAAALTFVLLYPSKPAALPSHPILRITRDNVSGAPAISPDGKLIAYTSGRADGNRDIYVQQTNSRSAIRITDDPALDTFPNFSPDGSRIYFFSYRDPHGIYEVPTLGGDARLLIPNANAARPSPDGKYIAYTRENDLFTDTLPPSNPVRIGATTKPIVWSPDSSELLTFAFGGQYEIVSRDGKSRRLLGIEPNLKNRQMLAGTFFMIYDWMPSGDIIFTTNQGDAINVFRTPIASAATAPFTALTQGTSFYFITARAAAGKLVFTTNDTLQEMWSLPGDINAGKVSGEFHRFSPERADAFHPTIHPDGNLLAYASRKFGTQDIFFYDPRTGKERLFASGDRHGDLSHLRFSPDGKLLAATTGNTAANTYHIVAFPTAGGPPKTLSETGARLRGWSPDGHYIVLWHQANKIAVLDTSTSAITEILAKKDEVFGEPALSSDGKWLAFVDTQYHLYIAPFRGPQPIPQSAWILASPRAAFPVWSPDGNSLYFSTIGSPRNLPTCYRLRLDPATKKPIGEAAPFYTFEKFNFAGPITNPIIATLNQLIVIVTNSSSDIWITDLP